MAPLNRWAELLLLGVARISMGVQFQTVGALGPLLVGPLVSDYAGLGSLIGAYSLAGVVLALPAGWLLSRYGETRILLVGLLLMTLGGGLLAAVPEASGWGIRVAMLGRLVSGSGATLLTVACAKLVLDRFSGQSLAPAMGVMLSAWPIGIALALVLLPAFGADWRMGLAASALLCGAALLALLWGLPASPPMRREGPVARQPRLRPGEWLPLLAVGALWATYNAAFAVVLGFAPAFLVAQGESPQAAGAVSSLVSWAILPLLPLGGAIAERLGRPLLACAACILCMIAALLALVAGAPAWMALVAYGLLSGPPASLIMALLGRVLAPESRGFGVGIHYMMFYGGLALLPPVAGLLRDLTGAPAAPLLAGAGFLGLSFGSLVAVGLLIQRQASMSAAAAARPAQ
jgi:MFS family permease